MTTPFTHKTVQLSPNHKPVMVRVAPSIARPAMFRRMIFHTTNEGFRAISSAAASAKMKQAEWLRQAVQEKLERQEKNQ